MPCEIVALSSVDPFKGYHQYIEMKSSRKENYWLSSVDSFIVRFKKNSMSMA